MTTTTKADSILTEIASSINEHLEGNRDVNVFAMPARMPIVNNFALLFYKALLQTVDDYKLSLNDLRVMLKILEMMQFGNIWMGSWTDVANSLSISRYNMPRHVKKLKAAKLLIEVGHTIYLNPQIIAKGKFLQRENEDMIEILDAGAKALADSNIEPNILTPKIRQATLFEAYGGNSHKQKNK